MVDYCYLGFGEKAKNLVFKKSTNNSTNPPKADKCEYPSVKPVVKSNIFIYNPERVE